ncbi:hypothetical protein PoB_002691000 [Plakobranchus ocellatus]|uniref:Uncharacterized protein n=1 Tax=Plakobranchus ocellatus TaxID=259542 RepID=A0AAV4A0F9_9GAST|nr:hypothetical protein PoB_002691000 [Plakobranchus ocellatus]
MPWSCGIWVIQSLTVRDEPCRDRIIAVERRQDINRAGVTALLSPGKSGMSCLPLPSEVLLPTRRKHIICLIQSHLEQQY